MREISMQSIFGGLRQDYDIPYEQISCHRMIVGRMFCGYSINAAQRDYIRWWLQEDPEYVEETASMGVCWKYGMSFYTPDFTEPSFFDKGFHPKAWEHCRDHWIKERVVAHMGLRPLADPPPPRYREWLDIWGHWYELRATAQLKREP